MKFKTVVMTTQEGEIRDVWEGKVASIEEDGTVVILDFKTSNVVTDYAIDEWAWVTTERIEG